MQSFAEVATPKHDKTVQSQVLDVKEITGVEACIDTGSGKYSRADGTALVKSLHESHQL